MSTLGRTWKKKSGARSDNFRGRKHSEAIKQKVSATMKGRKQTHEHTERIRRALTGVPHTLERRANSSLGHMGIRHKEGCPCGYCRATPYEMTNLSFDLAAILLREGYDLVSEVRFGRYTVDLYEPNRHIAFEADGAYWHSLRVEYDENRDRILRERFGLEVRRYTELRIRELSRRFDETKTGG